MKRKTSAILSIGAILVAALGGMGRAQVDPLPARAASMCETDAASGSTQYLTIPAAAFTPVDEGCDYQNHGRYLVHNGGTDGFYQAPVHLPQSALVHEVTFYFYDDAATKNVYADLLWTDLAGNETYMAEMNSSGAPGYGSDTDATVSDGQIDNATRSYWISAELLASTGPGDNTRLCSVVIAYTRTALEPADKGYLSLPAAAFAPYEDGYDFLNVGASLEHYYSPGGGTANGWYLAPVFLPHGAVVTKITFYFYINSAYPGWAKLQRTQLGLGNYEEMASTNTGVGNFSYASQYDNGISGATIDNAHYAYWVVLDLPATSKPNSNVRGCGVVVEYDKPATVPIVNYISVPAAAFRPFADEWDYQDHGRYLKHFGGATRAHYEAPVYLPQGAAVDTVTFYYKKDWPGEYGYAHLCRSDLANADTWFPMVSITSLAYIPPEGWGETSNNRIVVPGVDNAQHSYWAYWDLPISTGAGQDIWGCGVVIRYTYRAYLPLILKNK